MTTEKPSLYATLQNNVAYWRQDGYPCDAHPAIAEILEYATVTLDGQPALRYLREAQFRALETYWYVRLIENTPHIFDLYQKYYPKPGNILAALDLDSQPLKDFTLNEGLPALWAAIRADAAFVKTHQLQSVHETLTLDYPSYILALAMGAGKTMLIGAIIATEFALAMEYHPAEDGFFVQNALVFAPGLTIQESLRELAAVDYSRILPPRLHHVFDASYKIIFTRDGQKDLSVIRGSRYNLIVTNTEKIRIQKRNYRHASWTEMQYKLNLEQAEAEANLRLQAIASLPNLAVFSDEAHHTYGKAVGKQLKRVRQTVDYLHQNTNLIAVVNTTGTPYFDRQPLRDVVFWYGLSSGIADNILKAVDNSILAYDYTDARDFITEIITDFFGNYGDVTLPNGAPARLALYFPKNKDLDELRPAIEQTLLRLGYPADIVLRNTQQSSQAEIDAFNRLNHPHAPHRVILLVNKGTEGWDCPSLFACALARKLTSSNNFVLQAGTRCLRQVPGNSHKARIYLSMDNRNILDRQLQETYGETISGLNRSGQLTRTARLVLRKTNLPDLVIKKMIKRIVPRASTAALAGFKLTKPATAPETFILKQVFSPEQQPHTPTVMKQVAEAKVAVAVKGRDLYTTAADLSATYRLPVGDLYRQLKQLYGPNAIVPDTHLAHLQRQIEDQTQHYEVVEEEVEIALALVKVEGFTAEVEAETGAVVYTTQITYQVGREHLLLRWQDFTGQNPHDFGFHYDPYNFDSRPEINFFTQMLTHLNLEPAEVDDLLFTGALTDPGKTDFYVEYQGERGKIHRYTPDFIVRRKDGRCYLVEIKAEDERADAINGEAGAKAIAVQKWVDLNPDILKYQMIFTANDEIAFNALIPVKEFIKEPANEPAPEN